MPLVSSNLTRQSGFIFVAIACAAMGFVLGSAFFDDSLRPPSTYGKRWLIITVIISAAFVIGLICEYVLGKFRKPHPPPQAPPAVERLLASIERRFRGDRTDEEYQRAEHGVVTLVAICAILAMLFTIGIWVIAAIAIVYCMIMLVELYMSFKEAGRSPRAKIGGALFSGAIQGVLFGYFFGPI